MKLSGSTGGTGAPSSRAAGGGLRGFAHLGVLRVLRRLGIEPDRVVGTRDSGQTQAFGVGAALQAILASAAQPGALVPAKIGEHEYLDGAWLSRAAPRRTAAHQRQRPLHGLSFDRLYFACAQPTLLRF